MFSDTIAAIATPIGVGGVGIVRVSGPDVMRVLRRLFPNRDHWAPRHVYFDVIRDPELGVGLDSGCVILFRGPASYTGEDVVEFQVHSSPQVLQSILSVVIACGVRLADKGEFTKRAFVNGKLDLTQAESVIDLIHAKTPLAQQVSLGRLQGVLLSRIVDIRMSLMGFLEQIEGSIDFPDEVPAVDREMMVDGIRDIVAVLGKVFRVQDLGKWVHSGVTCVIVGRPNVGKSSLLNGLLGEARAIVTPIPGTTRDFIDAQVSLGGVTFSFVDTAGLRDETTDVIELLGMKRIRGLLRSADVVLWVVDGSMALLPEDIRILEKLRRKRLYVLVNKSDKRRRVDLSGLSLRKGARVLSISAKRGDGLDDLKAALHTDFVENLARADLDYLCNVRQVAALRAVREHLMHLLGQHEAGVVDDALSIDLKGAILKLGEVTGDDVTEEVLDGIFSRFCVGK